jgi:beta-phosphoglucomutase
MDSIKAFIFDLDGVLVDTAKYHFKAWKRLASELGISFTHQENEQLKGVSRKESLEMILKWGNTTLSEERKEELMVQKNDWYLELIAQMDTHEVLPGVRDFLQRSKDLQLKIALGSASKNARLILEKVDLLSFFDALIDGNSTTKSKPHPQVFLLGAEALDVAPAHAIVFEDAIAGVKAAKNGGFTAIGIGDKNILSEADVVLNGLEGIHPQHLINQL